MRAPVASAAGIVPITRVRPIMSVPLVTFTELTGVKDGEGAEGSPVPVITLVAVTVNVYATPSVRPVTNTAVPAVVAVAPPGEAVAV